MPNPYNAHQHGEAEFNSWTTIASGFVPEGSTRPDNGSHYGRLVHVANALTLSAGNIEIGAVELKDATTEDRANIRTNVNTTNNELLVNLQGHQCVENTSFTPLGADGVFVGSGWQDTIDYGVLSVAIHTDQDSAVDGLEIQWSHDGITPDDFDVFNIQANKSKTFTFGPAQRYYRIKYTNGSIAQSEFHLVSILRRCYVKPSSHRITDNIVGEDDAELVKSILAGEDEDGTFQNVTTTRDGALNVSNISDGLSIAENNVTGKTYVHKFGVTPDFDQSDGEVTAWDGADDGSLNQMVYQYSSTAIIDSISSSNAGDTVDIEIDGLDSDYNLVIQTITLNGRTRVPLTTNLIRTFRMKNVGSTDLLGDVYVYENTALTLGVPNDSTKVRSIIRNGNNQTLMALYTIPLGKTGYLRSWHAATAGSNKDSNYIVKLYSRPFGQVFQVKHVSSMGDQGTSAYQHTYVEPQVIYEKTDIQMTIEMTVPGGTGAAVGAGFDLVIVDN